MNKVVPGHLQDFDCQSLKLGRQSSPETPSLPVGEAKPQSPPGDSSTSPQPWAGPPRLKQGEPRKASFPSGVLWGWIRVSILRAQYSEVNIHIYWYVSSKFQSHSLEILRESFFPRQLNPGWFVGTKIFVSLVSFPTFFSPPPKSVAGSCCQSGILGAYWTQI